MASEDKKEKKQENRRGKKKKRNRKTDRSGISALVMDRRLMWLFLVAVVLITIAAVRFGYIQIVKADEYSAAAVKNQTRSIDVTSERGSIYDAKGKTLAMNQAGYSVWVSPEEIKAQEESDKNSSNTDHKEKFTAEKMAERISGVITDMTETEIYNKLDSNKKSVELAEYVDKNTGKKIRKMMKDGSVTGVQLTSTSKRYYPLGEFASHVIGATNDENTGMFGLERYYDQYLNGRSGRIVSRTDTYGRSLSSGIKSYYAGTDGLNAVLTIDEVIQHYVEKSIKEVYANTSAQRVMAIAMNPKTGAVLAMADYPDFDLNDPRTPLDKEEKAKVDKMSDVDKVKYWNGTMWRNPMVNDTYEPGSPFKLLTTSMALEEGLTSVGDRFVCNGTIYVAGQPLRCWRYYAPHGAETLAQGVANSCNPVFITLSQRLGKDKFYTYLDRYGLDSRTGIDYPGETSAIIQNKDTSGPVELATMSYGQGIAVTPIQLITAFTSIGNDGRMMKPRLVEKLTDSNGKTVKEFKPEAIRQVVSPSTAGDVCRMMEGVVRKGTGSAAYIPGYRIGGKTGTAQKVVDGRYTDYTYSSFFAMAPMDDPQFAVLLIVDSPEGVHSGGKTAGPGVKSIMSDCLKYLNITPVYTDNEKADATSMVAVPNVTGMSYSKAMEELKNVELDAIACPSGSEDFRVARQYPDEGSQLSPGDSVCLYADS